MKVGDRVRFMKDTQTGGGVKFSKDEILTIVSYEGGINVTLKNNNGEVIITDIDRIEEAPPMNNKIEITLNGEKVMLDVDRARELGLIESVKKEVINNE